MNQEIKNLQYAVIELFESLKEGSMTKDSFEALEQIRLDLMMEEEN